MGCKVSKWQDKSNEEINIAVTCHAHNCEKWEVSEDGKSFYHCGYDGGQHFEIYVLDYCGDWSFSGPLIKDGKISISAGMTLIGDGNYDWSDCWFCNNRQGITAQDENPLRAAMIVYLEMNGVQPNE